MARPRPVVPGASYLITRRCYQRTFRMRPHEVTNNIAMYCLAVAAKEHGVLVHAAVVMSNHHQVVITDVNGVLPDFLRDLHRSMAKALNASQGQWENLWSAEHPSAVLLPTLDDIADKIAYVVANPTAAGLVKTPEQWPGMLVWKPAAVRVAKRPAVYFDPFGLAPAKVELRIVPPPLACDAPQAWAERVCRSVARKVKEAHDDIIARGMDFMGAHAVMSKSFLHRAVSYEEKRKINPVLAARDISVRKTFREMFLAFQKAYRAALVAWQEGKRHVAFPYGTWWMRVHHRANVLPAPL